MEWVTLNGTLYDNDQVTLFDQSAAAAAAAVVRKLNL